MEQRLPNQTQNRNIGHITVAEGRQGSKPGQHNKDRQMKKKKTSGPGFNLIPNARFRRARYTLFLMINGIPSK